MGGQVGTLSRHWRTRPHARLRLASGPPPWGNRGSESEREPWTLGRGVLAVVLVFHDRHYCDRCDRARRRQSWGPPASLTGAAALRRPARRLAPRLGAAHAQSSTCGRNVCASFEQLWNLQVIASPLANRMLIGFVWHEDPGRAGTRRRRAIGEGSVVARRIASLTPESPGHS
jgi:hypothetical protein